VIHQVQKPLLPTPTALAVITLLLLLMSCIDPDVELEVMAESESPALRVVTPEAFASALAAASRSPVQPVTILIVPCDPPGAARPRLVNGQDVPSSPARGESRWCFVQLDQE
jgi:hypothetical protein